jgi:WD40 repeat protein/beta-lactamase regulating signal transducer with metallopeptidase domain
MPAVPFDALVNNVLVAAATAVAAFVCGRWANRPALAHVLWLLVLVKLATPPLFALPVRVLPADPPAVLPDPRPIPSSSSAFAEETFVAAAPVANTPIPIPETSTEPIAPRRASIFWPSIFLAVWLAGTATWLTLTALHVRRFNRYLRFSEAAPESFVREVAEVAVRMNVAVPSVRLLPGEVAPFVWSFGRTTLYVPENLRDRLAPEQRATVIAHELAHLWRRDHLVRWIEMIAVAAFWWLPLAWYARRELRRLEEVCCDAVVVANFPDANGVYASAILDTIDFLAGSRPTPRMASAIGDVSSLHRRLTRILDGVPPRMLSRPQRIALFAFAAALLATAPRLSQATASALASEPRANESTTSIRETGFPEAVQFLSTPIRLNLSDVRGRFAAAALSPDGSRVALANDAEVCVWDLRERRIAFRYRGHSATVNAVIFSPDGRTIASAGNDAVVRVWSAVDGADVRLFDGHANWIFALAYSPDGSELASAGYDRRIRIWNLERGVSVHTLAGHDAAVRAIAFSPDGRRLASAGGDGRLAIWDVRSGDVVRSIAAFRGAVRAIAFSPDGTRIAAGGDDRAVRFWNTSHGAPSASIPVADAVTTLRFTPGGTVLLAGQFGGQIANIRPQTGTLRGSVGPARPIHADAIAALLTSPNGHALLSVSHDGAVFAWPSAGLPETARREIYNHAQPVTCTAASPDGLWLATGTADGVVRIWNCATASEHRRLAAHVGGTIAIAFLGNSRLLTVGRDEHVRVWDLANGQAVRHLALPTADVRIALAPDARQLAVVGPKMAGAMIWDVETGRVAKRYGARLGGLTAVAFGPDDRRLFVGSPAGDLIAFDRATGKEDSRLDVSNEAGIERIAFDRFGERAVLVLKHRDDAERAGSHEIAIWHVKERTVREWSRPLLTDGPIATISFHRDDMSILTAGHDGFLVEWDAATGQRLRSIHAHLEAVQGFQLLAGNSVVTAGDRLAKLWDWPQETRP